MPRINFIYFVLISLPVLLSAPSAEVAGASLMLSPSSESFVMKDKILVEVMVDTGGAAINAVQATVCFPVDNLEVLNISKNDAAFSLWPEEPVFDNLNGTISFAGGLPHPGLSETVNLITIEFKAKKEGVVTLNFDKAQVLADDGLGTDILAYLKAAKYIIFQEIVFPQIFSPTHPQENDWYNNNNPKFQWNLTPEIIGVSFILDQNEATVPDTISEGIIQSKDYEKTSDGVWYFHLRFENAGGWQTPLHFKIQIDSAPPHAFEVVIDNAGDPTNPRPNLYFETNDDISGISYYKLQIDKENFVKLMLAQINPFPLSNQLPGQHKIIVRAIDQAGNNVEAKTVLDVAPIESPTVTLWPRIYIAGEEVLYLEGRASSNTDIFLFLNKDGQNLKEWRVVSNEQGAWFFSTKELIKSGAYDLSVQAQDKRGALSLVSVTYPMAVSFKGLSWGPLMVSFKTLVSLLLAFLLLGLAILGFFIYRINVAKKVLRKETKEAKENLSRVFGALREEVKEQVELFDTHTGFSEQEKKVYDDLKVALDISEELIQKEIHDVEKEL